MKTNIIILSILALATSLGQAIAATSAYPNLQKICDDAKKQPMFNGKIVLSTTVNMAENWSLNMRCIYGSPLLDGQPMNVLQKIVLEGEHFVLGDGNTYFDETITGNARVQQVTTNGKPEFDLVFVGPHQKIIIREFLRLDNTGQPIVMKNRLDGTLDPSEVANAGQDSAEYVSGIAIEEDGVALSQTCSEANGSAFADMDIGCSDPTQGRHKVFLANTANVSASPAIQLTWPLAQPAPLNLNPPGELQFEESLKEFENSVNNGKLSEQDFQTDLQNEMSSFKSSYAGN